MLIPTVGPRTHTVRGTGHRRVVQPLSSVGERTWALHQGLAHKLPGFARHSLIVVTILARTPCTLAHDPCLGMARPQMKTTLT